MQCFRVLPGSERVPLEGLHRDVLMFVVAIYTGNTNCIKISMNSNISELTLYLSIHVQSCTFRTIRNSFIVI